jgi:hypothetical protein
MAAFEHTVFTTRSGSIVGTGFGCPRCFRVLDRAGLDMTPGPRVDLSTAFRTLAQSSGARSGQAALRSSAVPLREPVGTGTEGSATLR